MKFIKFIFLFIAFFYATISFAQQAKSEQKTDSTATSELSNYLEQRVGIEKQRIEDSIQRLKLEVELSLLKTTDNLKKDALVKELNAIKQKDSIRLVNKKNEINKLRNSVKGYAVAGFFKDTLFVIYNKQGSFSASERADAISVKVKKLANDFGFNKDSLKILPAETSVDLVYQENIIVSVSENDAIWENSTKLDLATRYKKIIETAVLHYKDETSIITLAKEIGLALLVIFIIGLIIRYLIKLFQWTERKIDSQKGTRIRGINIQNYTLFDADKQAKVLHFFNKLLKWMLVILILYIALPILFGIFPWTKDLTETLFGYILNPLKKMLLAVWNYVPNLITILVIVFVFRYVIKGAHYLKNEIATGALKISGFYPDWANPTLQIIKVLLYAFMFILIFPYLPGSDSPIFQGVSVFLGFLFTFGSAGSLSNVIAGLVLTYMRLFKMGDRVKIGDVTGDVIEKSLLVTRIRTAHNEIISIPNSNVMSSHTINYSSDKDSKGLILHTTVTIGYDVPWKDMYQTLLTAADRTEFVLKEPKPFVLQTSLEDFYVSYELNVYTKEANRQATVYSLLHANIQDCCNEAGIEIMSPHYRAGRDGNRTTIPENYLPKDYEVPGFNVNSSKAK